MTVRTIDSTSVLICRLNIVILTILPFILFTVDFYRLQQTLILFNYCAISNWMVQPSLKKRYYVTINLKNTVYLWMTLFFAFLNLFLLVLRSSNINTVFRAFFEKNILKSRIFKNRAHSFSRFLTVSAPQKLKKVNEIRLPPRHKKGVATNAELRLLFCLV